MNEEKKDGLMGWAIVELFGHQKIIGVVSETTIAGGAFLRVDVPASGQEKAFTRFFGQAAIYSISPISEQIGIVLASTFQAQPVHPYDLPQAFKGASLKSLSNSEGEVDHCSGCDNPRGACCCHD
ncbi:MAG: hypothetical protein KGL39_59915 [Patescibacteria group bacterium]|nr:hypothetical protein [Patescibacteria group bacterium]